MTPRWHTNGCGCGVDVHAHFVPHTLPRCASSLVPADWPSMAPADACHRSVMVAGKVYRTVSDRCWDAPRRLEDLAEMNVALQMVSPMPELLSYWMPLEPARQLVRYMNEEMARLVGEGAGRIGALAAVPLQDVSAAIAELHYAVESLGFSGVEIGSNINGVPIGSPRFDQFFEACEALDVCVFVHALRPAGMERLVGPAALQQVLAYPTDVGLAAASVITGNLLLKRPALRMAFSHGGGTLMSLLPRLQEGWRVFPAVRDAMAESPVAQAQRLFYDTLVFDRSTLRHLVQVFGATQLLIGTDHPFNFSERHPVQQITEAGFDAPTVQQLLQGNARRFLGQMEGSPA